MNKSYFDALHKDKMSIFRNEEVKVNGVTRFEPIEKYTDVACRLSRKQLRGVAEGNIPEISLAHKIFCNHSVDILKGDKIVLTERSGKLYEFIAGESFPYGSHLEVDVRIKEIA